MIVQFVSFESSLPETEVLKVAEDRIESFRALPGLLQKTYVKLPEPNRYGGIYLWDSIESMKAFHESDLAATIPSAYKVVGAPKVEIMEAMFQLREAKRLMEAE